MGKLIYVETTIPSFFSEKRTAPAIEVRRKWTREWWSKPRPGQRLVTSAVVLELQEKDYESEM